MDTGLSRRGLFGASAAAAAILAGTTSAAASPHQSQMTLRWWGNNGWEIRVGTKTILIDPWLTRFKTGTYTPAGADPKTPLSVNKALIDGYLDRGELRADHILVTHGHYDHLTDVPYLAKRTGATVFGTETHLSLMAALGAPEDQLAIASGGEDLTFDGYSIRILRSLHSATGERARVPFPGSRPLSRRDRPRVIEDLYEGGTLAYQVTGGGASVLDFGGSNYVESELAGLRPDVVLVPVGGAKVTQYVPRLLRALGNPRYVAATHWDDFDLPLGQAHDPNGGLETLRKAVAATSSRFVVLDHLGEFTP
ncbi:L-ascorbate metabolism protein UlaG, beta-lactamase superfamily [Amycolatopsis pretoriensis]|uniref:L-ascorbate metabolism protein UlaG, beta-lactamase superfamily n=1 Tax=Amycolatopsis pretoriensis TaxID=218821 RepID=A0A1H5RGL6_9PSEU|nr:MBL fold metallo-hydrolase [Amycolatopsis pretoriensis]SEF37224.1 L-ascorbate metabolism protein UlaG, beta-lactamase superfamily [Amycolatopsis pretoriensis]